MSCIHQREDFFVGLGHPRCGTGFTTSLIASAGLDIGHEFVRENGIVSWMLPAERYRNPFNDAIGPLASFPNIFCIARSPLAAIPSIIPENHARESYKFRRHVIRERFGADHFAALRKHGPVSVAIASYTCWFELCLGFRPGVIFRVDREADDALLSEFLGTPVRRNDDIPRNSRPARRNKDFAPEMLADVPEPWLDRLAALCGRLGYDEDAAQIARHVGG